jgi:hypothetical protein
MHYLVTTKSFKTESKIPRINVGWMVQLQNIVYNEGNSTNI